MRIALCMVACCLTLAGVLSPRAAVADEAALRRTAPDECIAWFAWAGLDSLGKAGADTKNRTEQLLADEEVRAFLDSVGKTLGGAIAEDADEETEIALRIAQTLAARPSVAFLSKIEQVEQQLPPRAPEPETPPPTQAIIVPTTQVTVGDDGVERIGIDFDVEVTAGDGAVVTSAVETNPKSPAIQRPVFVDVGDVVTEAEELASGTTGASATVAGTIPRPATAWYSPSVPSVPAAPPACAICPLTTTTTVVHGAVVVDLGDEAAEMRALFDKMESESVALPRKSIAGVEFARVSWEQPMWVAFREAYLIVAFDEATAEQVVAGLSGKRDVPTWLADLDKKLPVERPAARVHVNIDALVTLADEPFEAETKAAVKLLGLDQVSAISWVAGLDEVGTAVKTLIATRDGVDVPLVLDVFGAKGLTAGDLRSIPKDATMAAAGKFDAQRIVELGVKLAALDDEDAETAWEAVKKQLAEQMFIDLSKDVVEAIGDTWTLHYSPSEGGLMATTFTLAVRDELRLTAALEKLALVANADEAYVRKFTYRGQDVYYWQGGGDGGSAAWCIRDGRLVASMLPQTIKAYIARGALKETLADVPAVTPLLADGDEQNGPLVLTYTDTRDILRWCYQYGSFLLPTIGQALSEEEDIGFALHEIPSLAVIEQYFAPSITTVSRTDAGLLIDSRQTVPFTSGLLALSTLSGVGGGVYELAFDDSGLGNVVDLAESVVDMPLGISFGSPTNSMQCIGGACSPYQGAMPNPPVAAVPAIGPASQPSPSYQPGPVSQPVPTSPGVPAYQPSPWQPVTPNVTPVPYKVTRSVGEPYVPPPATPPQLPSYGSPPNLPATYQSPAQIGVPVEGKRKVFTPSSNLPQTLNRMPAGSRPIGLPAPTNGYDEPAANWTQPGRLPATEAPVATSPNPTSPYPATTYPETTYPAANPYAPPQKSPAARHAPVIQLPSSDGVAPGAAYEIPTYRTADAKAYVPDISFPNPSPNKLKIRVLRNVDPGHSFPNPFENRIAEPSGHGVSEDATATEPATANPTRAASRTGRRSRRR